MSAEIHTLNDYIDEDDLILVPEGEYQLSYRHHKTWLLMGRRPKLVVVFRIADLGPHFDKPILAYYNPTKIIGKPRMNGKFSAGWRTKIMFHYARCFGAPSRKDRIVMSRFKDDLVRAKVRTVFRNMSQKEYPECLRYSVVDEVLGLVEY